MMRSFKRVLLQTPNQAIHCTCLFWFGFKGIGIAIKNLRDIFRKAQITQSMKWIEFKLTRNEFF